MGYFNQVRFVFLGVCLTKNAADQIFNLLKLKYRKINVHTMEELFCVLNMSGHVTVHPTKPDDFADWNMFLNLFYGKYSHSESRGLIKQNHKYSYNYSQDMVGNQLLVNLQRRNLDDHNAVEHKIIEQGFFGRKDYPKNSKGLKMAVDARPAIMKAAIKQNLKSIEPPGINIFKQVELATKYKKLIPQEDWGNEL